MPRFRLPLVLGLIATTATSGFAASAATSSKISPDAAAAPASSNLQVIIQYKQAPSGLEALLISLLGGLVKTTLGTIDALVANVPPDRTYSAGCRLQRHLYIAGSRGQCAPGREHFNSRVHDPANQCSGRLAKGFRRHQHWRRTH